MPLGDFESYDAVKAYVTCFLIGVALLFAYNALLSTPSYFKDYYKFAEDNENATTANPEFWKNVVSTVSLVSNIPNVIVQGMLLHPMSRKVKQHTKLVVGLCCMAASLVMIPIVSALKVGDKGSSAYLMSFVVMCSIGTACYQSTALSLVAGFPPKFVGVCIVGIGFSGVISNVIGIITQAAMPDTYDGHNNQARVFYGVAGGVIVITLIALSFFKYNPFAQRYVPEYREAAEARRLQSGAAERAALLSVADDSSNGGLIGDGNTTSVAINKSSPSSTPSKSAIVDRGTASEIAPSEAGNDSQCALPNDPLDSQAMFANTSALEMFKRTYPMQLSVFYTFVVTLFIMPSLAVAVDPEAVWYPILVITTFNVTDTIGRYLPNLKKLWCPRKAVVVGSLVRTLIIPLWFLAYKTNVIEGHTYPMILMGVTGLSNGYVGCMSMVYAPQSEGVDTDVEKNVSGNITSFMLLCGCASGSVLGWLVTTYS